ncbi:MAG TPA: alpha/beta hydrolase [Blastocatellia bacterium]|nr:alpha/beta hydrolase [Blastocatellia bacterium]
MRSFTAFSFLMLLLGAASGGMTQETRIAQEGTKRLLNRAVLNGIELEYEVRGAGEPVVLVHAGIIANWFKPLLEEPALTGRYRVVSYHRVGYAGSSRVAGPVSIAQQAAHLRLLMRRLGITRAHLVGHSSGANIALQLALDAPDMVHSLALLEPALPVAASGPERMLSTRAAMMATVMEHFRAGDKARAVDGFMRIVSGSAYRAVLERALPSAFDQAVADADTFFGQELPAVQQWSFRREDASRITQPALAVIGAKSQEVSPIWNERQEMLLTWLPKAEAFVLPNATHMLHVQNPRGMAEGLAAFFARHPLSPSTR